MMIQIKHPGRNTPQVKIVEINVYGLVYVEEVV